MSDSSSAETAHSQEAERNITSRRQKKGCVHIVQRNTMSDLQKLNFKVPPFSPDDPELWFAILESQFESLDISEDTFKFRSVVNNLDVNHAKTVKDIIVNPPPKNRYTKIKSELIKRLSASHERKVKQLLTHEELGDRKPSQFLRHLQDLAGASAPMDFIKSIWINRLPTSIQTLLASQSTQTLEQLADLADRVQELTSPYGFAVTAVSSSSPAPICYVNEITELKKMVEHLAVKLDEHTRSSCSSNYRSGRPRSQRKQSSSRQRSRSHSSYKRYPVCWYHSKFGDNARSCVKPCDFKKAGNSSGTR